MPTLPDLLDDLAEEARPYGDAAAAVRTAVTARRRRRVAGRLSVAAVLALVAGSVWGPRLMPADPWHARPAAPGAPSGPDRIFPYPSRPVPLLEQAQPLPADQGIGAASLVRVWESSDGDRINIVLPTGRQYQIELPDASPGFTSITLSPNGRFLLWTSPDGTVLRDLTGTGQSILPVRGWRMWAPDSGALLGVDAGNWWMLDPQTGNLRTVPPPDGALLLAGGRWLGGDGPVGTEQHEFVVRDSAGAQVGQFIVDPTPLLADGETVLSTDARPGYVMVGGDELAIMSVGDRAGGGVKAFIVFSTRDGAVLRRIDMPDPLWFHQTDLMSWDENLLVLTRTEQKHIAVFIVDPTTGERYEVSRLEYGRNVASHEVTRGAMATWD